MLGVCLVSWSSDVGNKILRGPHVFVCGSICGGPLDCISQRENRKKGFCEE